MRATHLFTTSIERDPGVGPGRRPARVASWDLLWRLLVVLSGALALLLFSEAKAPSGDSWNVSRTGMEASRQDNPVGTTGMSSPLDGSVRPVSDELETRSLDTSTLEAALPTVARVVLGTTVLYWLSAVRVQLRPGITFEVLVPG